MIDRQGKRNLGGIVLLAAFLLTVAAGLGLWLRWPTVPERAIGFRLPPGSRVICTDDGGYESSTFLQWVIESPTGKSQQLRRELSAKKKELFMDDGIETVKQMIQQVCPAGIQHASSARYCFAFTYDIDSAREVAVSLLVGDDWEVMLVKRQRKMGAK